MDDRATEVTRQLQVWLEAVAAPERSVSSADRFETTVGARSSRRAIVIERAHLLTRFIRARTTECQLRCEMYRIATRHQREATSDMRRRIAAMSASVRRASRASR